MHSSYRDCWQAVCIENPKAVQLRMALMCILLLPQAGFDHILEQFGGAGSHVFSTTCSCSENPSQCFLAVVQAARLITGNPASLKEPPLFHLTQSVAAESEAWKFDYIRKLKHDQFSLRSLASDTLWLCVAAGLFVTVSSGQGGCEGLGLES